MLPNFINQDLLNTALTHRSALNEQLSASKVSNERLEFLGDAVLEMATTEFLYARFPDRPEGELTAYRSALVKTTTLGQLALTLGLDSRLLMSKGEEAGGGRTNHSLLADTMEAIIGALFLDQGYQVVFEFLKEHLFVKVDDILEKKLYKDSKSQLQELVQAKGLDAPVYLVTSEVGPDHNKVFSVRVVVDGQTMATGEGKSKQLAQQDAAKKALQKYQ